MFLISYLQNKTEHKIEKYPVLQERLTRYRVRRQTLADHLGIKLMELYNFISSGHLPEGQSPEKMKRMITEYLESQKVPVRNLFRTNLQVKTFSRKRYYLKQICKDYEISYNDLAGAVAGFTKTDISNIVNLQFFSKKASKSDTQRLIEMYLRRRDVPEDVIEKAWHYMYEEAVEVIDKDTAQNIYTNVIRKILSKGVAMLHEEVLSAVGLKKDPFRNEMESMRDVFHSTPHDEVFKKMLDAAKHQKFLAVYGAVGSGKSTLKTLLYETLATESRYRIAELRMDEKEKAHVNHIHDAIIEDLGGMIAPRDKERKTRRVQAVLETLYRQGIKPVLIIDESHGLPNLTLKCLKRIHEHQVGFKKLIGIIILGQEELEIQLRKDVRVREVAARVELLELRPIKNFTINYLVWKIQRAGGRPDAIFTEDGFAEMQRKMPSATPLEINVLASHAVKLAYDRGSLPVNEEAVSHAYAALEGR